MSDEIKCKECGVILTLPYEKKDGVHWFNSDCVKNLQLEINELNHRIVELENPPLSGVEINTNFIHNKFGYCYYEIEEGKNPIVFNLFVHPEYRRRGHGKWLLDYVINEIRKTGYQGEINIEASPREESIGLDRLTSFYQELGLNVINATQEPDHG